MRSKQDNRDEKLEGNDITILKEPKAKKWLSNFLYHHKWTLIIVTFFVVVLVILFVQLFTKVDYDITITVAGHHSFPSAEKNLITNDLQTIMKDDINGDGEKNITIVHYPVYSESEMKKANSDKEKGILVNGQENTANFQQFFQYSGSGESSIFFVSEYLYKTMKDEERLLPLSEIFGDELPSGAMNDGYGVKLSESALYERYSSFEYLPKDTIVCIAKPLVWGNSSKEELYTKTKSYFKDILS